MKTGRLAASRGLMPVAMQMTLVMTGVTVKTSQVAIVIGKWLTRATLLETKASQQESVLQMFDHMTITVGILVTRSKCTNKTHQRPHYVQAHNGQIREQCKCPTMVKHTVGRHPGMQKKSLH